MADSRSDKSKFYGDFYTELMDAASFLRGLSQHGYPDVPGTGGEGDICSLVTHPTTAETDADTDIGSLRSAYSGLHDDVTARLDVLAAAFAALHTELEKITQWADHGGRRR